MKGEQLFGVTDLQGVDITYSQSGDEFSIVMSGTVDIFNPLKAIRDAGCMDGKTPVLVSLYISEDSDFEVQETPVEEGGNNGDASSGSN